MTVAAKEVTESNAPAGAALIAQAMDRREGVGRYKAMQSIMDWDRSRLAYRAVKRAFDIVFSGAALAVAFKTRDAKIKGLALPSALSAFMGITEPAIFGVNLRFFKPFIAGCIGGGCGALVCALTSLAASGTGVTGIFGILLCLAQPVQYAIMFAVAAVVSFAISFVLYKDEPKASEQA